MKEMAMMLDYFKNGPLVVSFYINSYIFEIYSFKKTQNGGKNDYDILDSAAKNFKNKNEEGEGSSDQK